ncbi:Protein CBR-NPP-10 [Caenorhabditis briggsae]|uniref:Nuclear pore complex protein Nup98-Nup96 n=1 Tax=Caenorhabditis briggsae TaxID=6238 RepID=A8X7Z9_CAEBR|nr:Protein CBR-NPP-10 [Caenorhabditis briggsae]CAP28760.2 Protein CBR-NPP-10 [Caenorhabditis briggsae]
MFGQNKSFGSSSFGSSSGSGLFGQNNQNKGLFGQNANQQTTSSSLFGNAQKPAGSLFGNTTNNTSNLFGSPQTQSNQSSLFGAQSNANRSLFGASTTTTQNSSSLFGGNTAGNAGTSSIFGSSNNTSGGGLFGATGSAMTGTTVKFDPPIASDTMMRNGTTQNISTKHMCISAMNKYIDKSMDELRVEDYMANRKAPAAGTTTTGNNLFGGSNTTTNQTGGGLFGNNTQQKTGLFGSTSTASPFGANNNATTTGSGLFGSNANTSAASNSLFGSKPATNSLFGNNNTGGSTFGQTTGSSLFGNQQQQGASTSLFGQPQQQQPAGGSLFGNSNTTTGSGLFGQNTQQQQASGFNFGGNNTVSVSFSKYLKIFDCLADYKQCFRPTRWYRRKFIRKHSNEYHWWFLVWIKTSHKHGIQLWRQSTNYYECIWFHEQHWWWSFRKQCCQARRPFRFNYYWHYWRWSFRLATSSHIGRTFRFKRPNHAAIKHWIWKFVVQQQVAPIPVIGVTADVLQMQANMKSLQSQLTYAPYGDSSLLKYNNSETNAKDSPMSAQQRQLRLLAAKKGSLLSPSQESSFIVPPISKVMSDLSPALSRTSEVTKDLNYTSKEAPPSLGRGLRNSTFNPNHSVANQSVHESSALNRTIDSTLDASINGTGNRLGIRGSTRKSNLKQLDLSVLGDSSRNGSIGRDSRVADPDALPRISENDRRSDIVTSTPSVDPVQAVMQRHQDRNRDPPSLNLDTTCDEHTGLEPVSTASSATSVVSTPSEENSTDNAAAGVKLSKPDYFSLPTINEMKSMVKNGRVVLEDGLTIGRSSYGSVYWPGKLELKDLVLDEIVVFRHREVTVYPNEEKKPDEGQELNRPAEVTLERIWYTDKKTKKEVRDVVKLAEVGWREHLERQTIRMGASFKDYRAETGSWVFRVEHFSKYGLADDDDEPMEVAPPQGQKAAPLQTLDMNTSVRDVNNQVQRKKIHLTPDAAQQRETVLEIVPAPVPLGDVVTIVRRRNVPGLGGGGVDIGREENNISTMANEFEDDESLTLEEGQQPEKKPKLELLNDLEYESSRFIRNMQELKVMPKPKEPAHRFNGGARETKMIGYGKSKLIDLAVVKGRNSRIGWSETGSLVWSSQPIHNEILFGTIDRASDVNEDTLISMLDVNIDHAETSRKGPSSQSSEATVSALTSTFATYTDTYSQMFRQYIDIAQSGGYDGHVSVWKLLLALFPAERQEGWSFERGEQISEWLKNEAIKNAPEERGVSRDSPSTAVWNQICVGDVEKAFHLAIDTNQPQLASILQSSIVCPEATIHCFKAQIENWKKCDILHLIPKSTLKCYILMAGLSHYQWTHEGQSHSINCMEGLSWVQALGLHVWYLRQWGGLEEAYDAYQKDVNAERAASNRGDLYGELIKLACESQHSVEVVLDCAAGENPHDHFLQWHVWSVLHSVGFRTMSKTAETRVHRGYAAQLEALKLNNYAMFILQHIEDDEERATAVRSLLNRFGCFGVNYPFEGISGQFDIPPEWIAEAQFSIAKADNDATQLFELAVAAKNYMEMRRLFVDEIAPTAVVAGDHEALKSACILLHPFENQIPEWGATGMVYMDYCRLVDLIENDVDEQHMQETLESLETRLHAPTFSKNTIQKLSLQTIGRLLFEYRADKNTLPEWTKLLGHRQLFKIFRDRSSWGIERFTIDFD